ncbi:MAG: 4'-phosphopantetheinyl transferase superfamily protein [Verrucomicrobiales bacterium]|nr:4'-phosphopantetheinyl transferase superfamily protein [Verrucomicrobiales bacterium]
MLRPGSHEIEVTSFALDDEAVLPLDLAREWLNEEERDRADRFIFPIHRDRFSRGRAMLRRLLAGHLGIGPDRVVFETSERGKPFLPGEPLHFNLSHSEGRAALAVSCLPSIGIDLECFDRRVDVDGLSRRCFRESELCGLRDLSDEEKRRAFFWIWTAKEARMKATGEGFHLEPQRIEIVCRDGLPRNCLEPAFPAAHVMPVVFPDGGAACTVVALSPFSVSLTEVPGF